MIHYKVLAVDSDPEFLLGLSRVLVYQIDFTSVTTLDSALQRANLATDVIIVGPMNQASVANDLQQLHRKAPEASFIMLTRPTDVTTALELVNQGIVKRMLPYPCTAKDVEQQVASLIGQVKPKREKTQIVDQMLQMLDALADDQQVGRILYGLERICPLIASELNCTYGPHESMAVRMTAVGLRILSPEEISCIRTGEFGTRGFELSLRRCFLNTAQLLSHLDGTDFVSLILTFAPFAYQWSEQTPPYQKFAAVLRAGVIACLLKNQGLAAEAVQQQLQLHCPYLPPAIVEQVVAMPTAAVSEVMVNLGNLKPGMVVLEQVDLCNGMVRLLPGQRLSVEVHTEIQHELLADTNRRIAVAGESIQEVNRSGRRESFTIDPFADRPQASF